MAKEKKSVETEKPTVSPDNVVASKTEKDVCGLIMSMSPMEGFPPGHWAEVRSILETAIARANYDPKIVSTADEAGVIQKRIVQNLATLPIVVCDISGRNANVMLELGLRFAFDQLVVVVKDDETVAPFDVSVMEWVEYPRSLRHRGIVEFQKNLKLKISATVKAGPGHTFLKSFGTFKVAAPKVETVPADQLRFDRLEESMDSIRRTVESLAGVRQSQEVAILRPTDGKKKLDSLIASMRLFVSSTGASAPARKDQIAPFVKRFSDWLIEIGHSPLTMWEASSARVYWKERLAAVPGVEPVNDAPR